MLRVVSGAVGGLKLKVPKGVEIRPTQDRIKQAIFSSLGEAIVGATVLDLYAGTGSLGIEALSRGAASVTFVESQKKCGDCIRENLAHCRLTGQVVQSDALEYLRGRSEPRYNIVLADPPYVKQRGPTELSAYWIALRSWLLPDALVVWEYCSAQEFIGPDESELIWNRHYGETAVALLRI